MPSHLLQTFLFGVQLFFSYILMLCFMTFNVWLCIAVVTGMTISYLAFGSRQERRNSSSHLWSNKTFNSVGPYCFRIAWSILSFLQFSYFLFNMIGAGVSMDPTMDMGGTATTMDMGGSTMTPMHMGPMMMMCFHFRIEEPILFKQWIPHSMVGKPWAHFLYPLLS